MTSSSRSQSSEVDDVLCQPRTLQDHESTSPSSGGMPNRRRRKTRKCEEDLIHCCSALSTSQVKTVLGVHYCEVKSHPKFFHIKDLPLQDLLQYLLDFECSGANKSEAMLKAMLGNTKEIKHSAIQEMMRESVLQINVKECSNSDCEAVENYSEKSSSKAFVLLKHLLTIADEVFACPVPTDDVHKGAHGILRKTLDWLSVAAGYQTKYLQRGSGECVLDFPWIFYPHGQSTRPVCTTIKGKPDFVFGPRHGSQYSIPVEVYAPYHSEEKTKAEDLTYTARHAKTKDSDCDDNVDDTKETGNSSRSELSSGCIPNVTELFPDISERQKRQFETKLCAQHVTHLLGIALEAATRGQDIAPNSQEEFVILGMFVINEYFFFSKMTVTQNFLLYMPRPATKQAGFQESVPKVEFFPTAFDITRFNHRLALICFLSHRAVKYFPDKSKT